MRPNHPRLTAALTRPALPATAADAPLDDASLDELARTLTPVDRASLVAVLRAIVARVERDGSTRAATALVDRLAEADRELERPVQRDADLLHLPFMAVYPGDDELA